MQRIYHQFFIMKVRMKISFEACYQCRTINELFHMAILKTYHDRKRLNMIKHPFPKVTKKMVSNI